jgi:hypothetical protein
MPLVTASSDLLKGASGLQQWQQHLSSDPKRPLNWLLFGKALKVHGTFKNVYRLVHLPINPLSVFASIGLGKVLQEVMKDEKMLTPETCYLYGMALANKDMKKRGISAESSLVKGRCFYYLAQQVEGVKRETYYRNSLLFLMQAAKYAIRKDLTAEAFNYIGEWYEEKGKTSLSLRYMNLSRKLDFIPAFIFLLDYYEHQGRGLSEKQISMMLPKEPISIFQFDYRPSVSERMSNAMSSLLKGQSKKVLKSIVALDRAANG